MDIDLPGEKPAGLLEVLCNNPFEIFDEAGAVFIADVKLLGASPAIQEPVGTDLDRPREVGLTFRFIPAEGCRKDAVVECL